MNEKARKARNEQCLAELFPTFRARVARVILELENKNIRPRIQDGWRSPADQLKAFETGHSKLKFGFHNVTSAAGTPESLAVDMLDDDSPVAPGKPYLLQLAAASKNAGLVTGIRWGVPKGALTAAIDAAVAAGDWSANVKVGWDPTHIQPTDVTVAEAKAGKRPK
jgi:hypothetical protein